MKGDNKMHEKALQRIDVLMVILDHPRQFGKKTREAALHELRTLQKQLGLDISYEKGYNKP